MPQRERALNVDASRLSAPDHAGLFAPGQLVETNFYTGHHTHWVLAKVLAINPRGEKDKETSYHIMRTDGQEDHVVPARHLRPAGECSGEGGRERQRERERKVLRVNISVAIHIWHWVSSHCPCAEPPCYRPHHHKADQPDAEHGARNSLLPKALVIGDKVGCCVVLCATRWVAAWVLCAWAKILCKCVGA